MTRSAGPRHHAIIGDGATAAAFATHVPLDPGDGLTIIGPGPAPGQFGRGLAYPDPGRGCLWRDAYLLNSPAEAVEPDFVPWVRERWDRIFPRISAVPGWVALNTGHLQAMDIAAMFLPRSIFGDFLVERAEAGLERQEARGVILTRIGTRATGIEQAETGFRVPLSDGAQIEADSVDVATGAPRQGGRLGFALHGNEDAILDRLRPGAPIVCIGANATMLDLIRLIRCKLCRDDVDLTILTLSGRLPEPLVWERPRRAPVTPRIAGPFGTAEEFLTALQAEITGFRAAGAVMAELRSGYRAFFDRHPLATLVPDQEEARKLPSDLGRILRVGSHETMVEFERLRQDNRLRLGPAPNRVEETGEGWQVWTGGKTIAADLVIDATGAAPGDLDPLAADLVARGWLEAHPSGIAVGPALEARVPGLRYLSPSVSEIGDVILPLPLYDVCDLARLAQTAAQTETA
ncbi:FAD/NAD(P)-binding protein [Ponticoccus sp. SC2-23]|uniref:FAD/NAD(P)-binding protein n=1 Tax=Alexandriicola marinus TaxID=2081710 RepID=UPI000FD9E888|nr:FAD/NAD(P)-binding protein [Alexandriicola marinus]MBM1222314.1 FAD/NAD(P)-binding protein [Ponticoccus sp. SC6-9]MBM1224427.1 FAD/NAD(P)-binding protein [Ponticoccus sp. SC6-15]MBM1229793.1 FAD/NAD(P)-binding protein [Ponticoccus sp. SC6-38]MBM1233393.1 FAD/NAD(P)-binding protein [Ponticoccus sp. SC6-45]MBM1236657.1 FAD/NAD(P)-binding protein [Ponticoccus sp. SC6-49]MBM1244701.1 FAD/NAD(P)-binding protein [Ponticoccus sp. SC2-64]MBM1246917.1 FAD/NAD(P)-binding protein [Ponticoccus sp. SC